MEGQVGAAGKRNMRAVVVFQLQRGWEPQPVGRSVVEQSHI